MAVLLKYKKSILLGLSLVLYIYFEYFSVGFENDEYFLIFLAFDAFIPLILAAVFYGLRGGFLVSLFIILVNSWLTFIVYKPFFPVSIFIGYYIMIFLFGITIGYIIDLNKKLKKVLVEKELLLKEIHHRIKNNLSLITSLLKIEEKKDVGIHDQTLLKNKMNELQERINSIRLIHDKLYQSNDFININAKDHFTSLIGSIQDTYEEKGKSIRYSLNIEDIQLKSDLLISLGLFTTEVIINALKHGFKNYDKGQIVFSLHRQPAHHLEIVISNDGDPFDEALRNKEPGLGMRLIESLSRQLNGQLTIHSNHTTSFKLIIPVEKELDAKSQIKIL